MDRKLPNEIHSILKSWLCILLACLCGLHGQCSHLFILSARVRHKRELNKQLREWKNTVRVYRLVIGRQHTPLVASVSLFVTHRTTHRCRVV
jgi:hypothetical protein